MNLHPRMQHSKNTFIKSSRFLNEATNTTSSRFFREATNTVSSRFFREATGRQTGPPNPQVRNGANVEAASCRFHHDYGPLVFLDANRQDVTSIFLVLIDRMPIGRFLRCGFLGALSWN